MTKAGGTFASHSRKEDYVNRVLANPVVLDQILIWRENDPRFMRRSQARRSGMQRQFTIELRVDYADNDKNDAMRKALSSAARHVFATATLLADNVKPQIAIFSDDFFSGHEEIALLDDVIAQGKAALEGVNGENGEETPVSSELLQAVRS